MSRSRRQISLAVYDASPCIGGAITSAAALAEVQRAHGIRTALFSVAEVDEEFVLPFDRHARVMPARPEATRGIAYLRRELARTVDLLGKWRRDRPDAVLLNNGPQANLAGLIAASLLGIPAAQYVRGPIAETRLARRSLAAASTVFAVGDEAARNVRTLGRVPTVVDEGLAASQQPTVRQAGATDFLFAASAFEWKGARLALEAYRHARELGARASLRLCLASPDLVDLPTHAASAASTKVEFNLSPTRLDRVRARCSVFIHGALRPEPFGRSLLEAMAAGLCPVVPDQGWPARVVKHGVNGLIYPHGNAAVLSAHLLMLDRDPALARQLGLAAKTSAVPFDAARTLAPVVSHLVALAG